MTPRGKPVVVLAVLAALTALEWCRLGNPDPAPAGAPADQFSATRAIAALHAVSVDAPHPLGTPAHDTVRDQVAQALRALDYTVEIQRTFACNAEPTCGEVANVIARRPGAPAGKAVVVVAHYDSKPAAPGASDDGTGVATLLEIARAIRGEQLANPVVFLIDDGEEAGLLGAEGYVADPRVREAGFIINVEARGTSGTPFLFETSREQRWLIPTVAGALPHPVTTSLFATIYDQLPNDTDLTVFKRAGLAGINFAYIGDGTQYHTQLDDFAHVDPGAVQRRGDQVLAMVRAFGGARLDDAAPGPAVWFDVLCAFVVWWPAGATVWIVAAALALVGFAIARGLRRGRLGLTGVALGVASTIAAVAIAAGLGLALTRLTGLGERGALFAPHPEPRIAAAWFIGLAAAIASAGAARRWASFDAVFAGCALTWNGLGLAVALTLPGAAYLLVVPGAVLALAAAARAALPGRAASPLGSIGEIAAGLAGLVAAAVVCLPFALVGHDALGGLSLTVTAVLIALLATTFAPLVSDTARRLAPGCLAIAAALGVAGALVPRHSVSHPRHQVISYVLDADAGTARWEIDNGERGGRAAAAEVSPAPVEPLAPPTAIVAAAPLAADGTRTITLDVASPRGAPRLTLIWRADAPPVALRINGVTPPPVPPRWQRSRATGWRRISVRGSSAGIEITERGAQPVELTVKDSSYGLPASAAERIRARAAAGAVPVHEGDVTSVEHRARW